MITGLAGKPSCGKSTFFKACTLADVAIANYPFTTLKATEGVAFVRVPCVDKEFNVSCNPRFGTCIRNTRFVPIKLMDIPGLIEGSYEGHGMGNQFLSEIAEADALIHVIDCSGSTNARGEPVQPLSYDPVNDIAFLEKEFDMWYFQIISKGWDKFARTVKMGKVKLSQSIAAQLSGLKVTEPMVIEALQKLPEEILSWKKPELLTLARFLRQHAKPMIIAANKIDIAGSKKNIERLKEKFPHELIIPCSADAELALKEAARAKLIDYIPGDNSFTIIAPSLTDAQKKGLAFIQENVLNIYGSTGVQECLDTAAFKLLKLIAIFPGGMNKLGDSEGRILPDCFLMKQGSTALDFAYRIHTDLGKNFVRAMDVKTKRPVGKEHVLLHRDVIEIMTSK